MLEVDPPARLRTGGGVPPEPAVVHVGRNVERNDDTVVAAACDLRHLRELRARVRVAPDFRVEEGKRPGEDVGRRRRVEPVRNAVERNELARTREGIQRLRRHEDRRRGVGRAGDREIGQRDVVQRPLIAAERGEERHAHVRHVADGRLEARIGLDLGPREAERGGQPGAAHQHERLAAQARTEAADLFGHHVIGPDGIGEQHVERGRERQRSHRLHREEVAKVQDEIRAGRRRFRAGAGRNGRRRGTARRRRSRSSRGARRPRCSRSRSAIPGSRARTGGSETALPRRATTARRRRAASAGRTCRSAAGNRGARCRSTWDSRR